MGNVTILHMGTRWKYSSVSRCQTVTLGMIQYFEAPNLTADDVVISGSRNDERRGSQIEVRYQERCRNEDRGSVMDSLILRSTDNRIPNLSFNLVQSPVR